VNGAILWANLHLLFWLSLVPFATGWMGQNHFAPVTVAVYGFALLMAAIAFTILARALIACNSADSPIAIAIGSDRKGKASLAIYAVGMHPSEPLDLGLAVRAGRGHLVPSRPPHRTGDGLVSFD